MVDSAPGRAALPQGRPALEEIWEWLSSVRDPEIPVLSVLDLGIVRGVEWNEGAEKCSVIITPTYSGCPATAVIQSGIRKELESHGLARIEVQVRLSPPWTTDWLSHHARQILHDYGIAPPTGSATTATILPILGCSASEPSPACPRCGSTRTSVISQFGSTLCKALYRCHECREPFEYFKAH